MAAVEAPPQIDPATGERIAIDPNTGERIAAGAAPSANASSAALFGAGGQAPQAGFVQSAANNLGIAPPTSPPTIGQSLIKAAEGPVVPLAESIYQGGKRTLGELGQAFDAVRQGSTAGAVYHGVKSLPILGPGLDTAADQYADKNYAGEAGTLTGTAGQLAPLVLGAKSAAAPAELPSLVSPIEDTTRHAAATVGVPNPVAFEKSLATAGPDLKRFARESGYPIDQASILRHDPNLIRNVSKVADQYATQLGEHYDKMLATADQAGTVDVGTPGHPKWASASTLDQMARDLNKKVNDAYSIPDRAERMAALQRLQDSGELGEAGRLGKLINETVATRNGLDPDAISQFRQHIAAARDVANQTNMADVNLAQKVGAMERGENPTNVRGGVTQTLIRGAGKAIKGNEREAAGRYLAQTIGKLPEANTPLPQPTIPTPTPLPARFTQQLPPIQPPVDVVPTADPAAAQALQARLEARRSANANAASANQTQAQTEFLHSQQLEQAAQAAADERAARAAAARQGRQATQTAQTKLEGEAARTVGRDRARAASANTGPRSLPPIGGQ